MANARRVGRPPPRSIAAVAPERLALPATTVGPATLERLEVRLIYFSFVTIATLGHGDIAPRRPLAQMLAVLEAIAEQFFVAVVMAWLVSLHAASRRPDARGNRENSTPSRSPCRRQ